MGYLEMVKILLCFIRAQREGNWHLYLATLKRMIPYFFRYDHVNYARWSVVFLAEMALLPQDVLMEFTAGNFVVKQSTRSFNQVSPDHSTEWLNVIGKKSGGLVGITRLSAALNRWALSFNLRSMIVKQTKQLILSSQTEEDDEDAYGDSESFHNESTSKRLRKDWVHYQTCIWKQADQPRPVLPMMNGWDSSGDELKPRLISQPPIPAACHELVTCSCSTTCLSRRCSCRKNSLLCMDSCGCQKNGACLNVLTDNIDS